MRRCHREWQAVRLHYICTTVHLYVHWGMCVGPLSNYWECYVEQQTAGTWMAAGYWLFRELPSPVCPASQRANQSNISLGASQPVSKALSEYGFNTLCLIAGIWFCLLCVPFCETVCSPMLVLRLLLGLFQFKSLQMFTHCWGDPYMWLWLFFH